MCAPSFAISVDQEGTAVGGGVSGWTYLAFNTVETLGEEPTVDAKYGPISELGLLLQMLLSD
jgi:hypothetical protein